MTHDYKAPWIHRWFARQIVWIVARKDALGWIGLTLFAFFIWAIFLIAGGVWK